MFQNSQDVCGIYNPAFILQCLSGPNTLQKASQQVAFGYVCALFRLPHALALSGQPQWEMQQPSKKEFSRTVYVVQLR